MSIYIGTIKNCKNYVQSIVKISEFSPLLLLSLGFWQCLLFSWTTLRGKHCRHLIAVMGVVDTFGPHTIYIWYSKAGIFNLNVKPWNIQPQTFQPDLLTFLILIKNLCFNLLLSNPEWTPLKFIYDISIRDFSIPKLDPWHFNLWNFYHSSLADPQCNTTKFFCVMF